MRAQAFRMLCHTHLGLGRHAHVHFGLDSPQQEWTHNLVQLGHNAVAHLLLDDVVRRAGVIQSPKVEPAHLKHVSRGTGNCGGSTASVAKRVRTSR